MAGPPEGYQRQRIYELKAEHPTWGAPRITQALEQEQGEWGAPPQRTVSRRLDEWKALGEDEKAGFGRLRWPESMGASLPWEASAAILELLAFPTPDGQRPTVRHARSFWRVTAAAPSLAFEQRQLLALHLEAADIVGGAEGTAYRREVEGALVRHAREPEASFCLQEEAGEQVVGSIGQYISKIKRQLRQQAETAEGADDE